MDLPSLELNQQEETKAQQTKEAMATENVVMNAFQDMKNNQEVQETIRLVLERFLSNPNPNADEEDITLEFENGVLELQNRLGKELINEKLQELADCIWDYL